MKNLLQEIAFHAASFLIVFLPVGWLIARVTGGVVNAIVVSAATYVLVLGIVKGLMKKKHDI
jgi:hypothetical protein